MFKPKPKKAGGRPDFVVARIAELQRQLTIETNEQRKDDLRQEISEWQRSAPKPSNDRGGRR
jgi:hypothetical protein